MTSHINFTKAGAIALVALSAAVLQPLAYAQPAVKPGGDSMQGGKPGAAAMPAGMDMKAMMKASSDKMAAMQMMGNTDMDFAMMMRVHHQGAIDMAQAELRDGKDPAMRKLAKAIIAAQKKEMAQFDKFLAKSGHPVEKMSK